jgi:hypothetical protein
MAGCKGLAVSEGHSAIELEVSLAAYEHDKGSRDALLCLRIV